MYFKTPSVAYQDWYISFKEIETGLPGEEITCPNLEKIEETFKQWLLTKIKDLRQLICVKWDYPSKRDKLKDDLDIAVALSSFLLEMRPDLPNPIALVTLLIIRGLDQFCKCSSKKVSNR
jgi:hypothetical protein